MRLVIAGGYDPRVSDNVECLSALLTRCTSLGLTYNVVSPRTLPPIPAPASNTETDPQVLFVLNFSHTQRTYLLTSHNTLALLYTPQNEHFGIVPVEAMVCGVPVIACNNGGPMESVLDPGAGGSPRTGYLVPSDPEKWTDALQKVLRLESGEREEMGRTARARVEEMFSLESLTKGIEAALQSAVALDGVAGGGAGVNIGLMCVGVAFGLWLSKHV
jgi:alpha-1,3/alpha-1,6-mannosyltransferase